MAVTRRARFKGQSGKRQGARIRSPYFGPFKVATGALFDKQDPTSHRGAAGGALGTAVAKEPAAQVLVQPDNPNVVHHIQSTYP